MKAITYSRYGPPEVLGLETLDVPEPREDEVRIRVRAVEVTKADCELRSFRFPVKWFWLPLRVGFGIRRPRRRVLGGYFAGEIDACGSAVTAFAPGDRVFGGASLRMGAYAEYCCLPERYTIAPMPENMTFAEAAAVPLGGLNALHFLRCASIQRGERLLINGAGGSIGLHAVQIAKSLGADVTVVDHGIKEAVLRGFGVDDFIDYTRERFTDRDESWDVIFDMVPSTPFRTCLARLRPGGRYLSGNPRLSLMLRSAATNRLTNKRVIWKFAGETKEELGTLREMIEAGTIRSIVDTTYPMAQVVDAHRRVETEQRLGAIVLTIE